MMTASTPSFFEGVGPIDGVTSLKVTDGNHWVGDPSGAGVKIEVFDNGDFTVSYDPNATDSPKVTVTGDNVKMHDFNPSAVEDMRVEVSGQGGFLNDLAWAVDADVNNMTEIRKGVYQITFSGIDANDCYQFRFAANGSHDDVFCCDSETALVGKDNCAVYDGHNIYFVVPEDDSTVTITLDMSKFDLAQGKYNASFTIRVIGPDGTEYISEGDTSVPPTKVTQGACFLGDANLDGAVDISDATTIRRYDVRWIDLSESALQLADVDGDHIVSIIDATWIQRWELKMNAPEGIGEPIAAS